MSLAAGHERIFRASSIIADNLDRALEAAKDWLRSSYLRPLSSLGGCAMSDEREDLTVWGGTVDGIRALAALGVPVTTHDLRDGIEWVKSQQARSGAFSSCEVDYEAAESTAWTLIMLGELGIDSGSDPVARSALKYLLVCIGPTGGVSTTPADVSSPRTMPTAMALWALKLHSVTESQRRRLIDWLRKTQDPDTCGWGVTAGTRPNTATTSQVLHALCIAEESPDENWMRSAADYVIGRQEQDGRWINGYEEWFTVAKPRTPVRCLNYGPGWELLAITHFRHPEAKVACLRAVRYLIDQQDQGAWLYDTSHPVRYVWCVSQCVLALKGWRDERVQNSRQNLPGLTGKAGIYLGDATITLRESVRSNLIYFTISALFAIQFRSGIVHIARSVTSWLSLSRVAIINNLASSLLWAAIAVVGGLIAKRIVTRKSRTTDH